MLSPIKHAELSSVSSADMQTPDFIRRTEQEVLVLAASRVRNLT
jgi:hypothetical protein